MTMSSAPDFQPMGELQFTLVDCPVCKSANRKPAFEKVTGGYKIEFCLCRDCNALYARNPVAEECLKDLYGSKEFFASDNPESDIAYFDFIGGEKFLRMTAKNRVNRIKQFQPGGKLLEIASAAGFFLIEAKEAGFDVQGVEISKPMAKWASQRWNVPVTDESIEDLALPSETFDVIASWGVLTILRDPIAVVRKVHAALKPGGLWAFNTYYHEGLWARLVGRNWYILRPQTSHIFTQRLLKDILEREGFRLLSKHRDRPHSDLMKIADVLMEDTGWKWLPKTIRSSGLKDVIIRIPLPDVIEYVWRKPS